MPRNPWFETVAEAQRRAKRRLPKSVYSALLAGSEKGLSYADNVESFGELGFAPHVAGLSAERDQATTVMGQPISMPVLISPTGVQAVHPDGEVAVARAAAARGMAMGLSSFASKPVEEVTAACSQIFFQIYWMGDRAAMEARLERARAAGCVGLILTLDWSFSHSRDWGSPSIPDEIDLKTMVAFAPEVALKPAWLLEFARTKKLPDLSVPNVVPLGQEAPKFFPAYGEWMGTPPPSWEDVAWLARDVGRAVHAQGHLPSRRRPRARSTPASPPSRCRTTAATTSTARRPPSGASRRSPTPWATRSRSCSTGASAGAATSSRPWPSAPGP